MELLGYLRFPAQNSIGCNVRLRAHFQQDALPQIPTPAFMFVDINHLRMGINLQHPVCFSLAAIGVKRFIYWIFDAPYWPCYSVDRISDLAGVFVWIGSTNVPNFSLIGWETDELLGVKISDIPYKLWTAGVSLIWPSPIGMKLVPDERSGPRTHWDQVPKNYYRPIFELWPLKVDICQCLTPYNFLTRGPNFQAICVLCTMELGQC